MQMAQFDLEGEWRLHAPVDLVWETLADATRYPGWWPGFIEVNRVTDDVVHFRVRGLLGIPMSFTWHVEARGPQSLEFRVDGDLVGHGSWEVRPVTAGSHVTFLGQLDLGPGWLRIATKVPGVARLMARHQRRLTARGRHALEVLVGRRGPSREVHPPAGA